MMLMSANERCTLCVAIFRMNSNVRRPDGDCLRRLCEGKLWVQDRGTNVGIFLFYVCASVTNHVEQSPRRKGDLDCVRPHGSLGVFSGSSTSERLRTLGGDHHTIRNPRTLFIGSNDQLAGQSVSSRLVTLQPGVVDAVSMLASPCSACIYYATLLVASRICSHVQLPACAIRMMSRSLTLQGYDALAELFGRHPSLGVFRLFKELNAANLLDLQAEILNLRRDLQVFTHGKDDSSACTECDYQTPSVYHMKESDRQSCPYHERIWRKKLEIREKLKEYSMSPSHSKRSNHELLC